MIVEHAIWHLIYSSEASMLYSYDTNLVPAQVEQWIGSEGKFWNNRKIPVMISSNQILF